MKAKIEKRWYTNSNGGRPAEWDNVEHSEMISVVECKALIGEYAYREARKRLHAGDYTNIATIKKDGIAYELYMIG